MVVQAVRGGMQYLDSCCSFLLFLSLYGSVLFSERHYNLMAETIYISNLRISNTVHNKQHDYFCTTFLPRNDLYQLRQMEHERKFRRTNAIVRIIDELLRNPLRFLRMVLPWSYARMNIKL